MADITKMLSVRQADRASGKGGDDLGKKATQAFLSMHIVSAGAHAVRNIRMYPIPDVQTDDQAVQKTMQELHVKWTDLYSKVQVAQGNADLWINDLCTSVSKTIPTHLIDYNSTYDAASDDIIALLGQAKKTGSSADLVQQALVLIGALQGQVQTYQKEIEKAAADLKDYAKRLQADHDALLDGSSGIQQLISIEQSEVDSLKADIDRLNNEIDTYQKQITEAAMGTGLGIFVACLGAVIFAVPGGEGIGFAVAVVGIGGIAAGGAVWGTLEAKVKHCQSEVAEDQRTRDALKQQVIALTALHLCLANALSKVENALVALSDVQVFWGVFETTLQHVIDDLNKPNAKLDIILDEMWVRVAKNNWHELVKLAESLLGETAPVEVRTAAAA
jgi:hypothetical protein